MQWSEMVYEVVVVFTARVLRTIFVYSQVGKLEHSWITQHGVLETLENPASGDERRSKELSRDILAVTSVDHISCAGIEELELLLTSVIDIVK